MLHKQWSLVSQHNPTHFLLVTIQYWWPATVTHLSHILQWAAKTLLCWIKSLAEQMLKYYFFKPSCHLSNYSAVFFLCVCGVGEWTGVTVLVHSQSLSLPPGWRHTPLRWEGQFWQVTLEQWSGKAREKYFCLHLCLCSLPFLILHFHSYRVKQIVHIRVFYNI